VLDSYGWSSTLRPQDAALGARARREHEQQQEQQQQQQQQEQAAPAPGSGGEQQVAAAAQERVARALEAARAAAVGLVLDTVAA
jgi:hypothetical protein